MIEVFATRDVRYVLGGGDRCNDVLWRYSSSYGHQCNSKCWTAKRKGKLKCSRTIMDARCPAMLQGPWRHWRGEMYYKYLQQFTKEKGLTLAHSIHTVPVIGHQGGEMFRS